MSLHPESTLGEQDLPVEEMPFIESTAQGWETQNESDESSVGQRLTLDLLNDGIEISAGDTNEYGWGSKNYIRHEETQYSAEDIQQMNTQLDEAGIEITPTDQFFRNGDSDFSENTLSTKN